MATKIKIITEKKRHPSRPDSWDSIFSKIQPEKIRPPFREMFLSIKEQFYSKRWMSKKQKDVVRKILKYQDRPYTVSARSFRGLPRAIYEGIY